MNRTSSGKSDWCTPPPVVAHVEHVFGRVPALDPCWNSASPVKADARWTPDACFELRGAWQKAPEYTFTMPWLDYTYVNPPYGNDPTGRAFKKKILEEARRGICMMVCVPANTGTEFMQALMSYGATKFCSPRVQFIDPASGLLCKGVMHDTALVLVGAKDLSMVDRHMSNAHVKGLVLGVPQE